MEDQLTNFRVRILKSALEDPEFNIADWYNQKRARHLNLDDVERRDGPETRMGDALAIVARHMLEDGIDSCYPNVSPPTNEPRFRVYRATDLAREYIIRDNDLDRSFLVQRNLLTNPDFRLATWYLGQIISERVYVRRYDEAMGELLGTIARTQWTAPDPLDNLPDTSLNDNSSLDLDSDSGTHSSMPGLRPISETGESNYDSDSFT